jgi:hypothetical protein
MKRREFVRNMSMASLAVSTGVLNSFGRNRAMNSTFTLQETFSLDSFEDEIEEYPSLVSNSQGDNWLFSLRRLPYPNIKEEIACYRFINGSWKESGSASSIPGEYEYPTAVCLPGKEPLVAWINCSGGIWSVQTTQYKNGKPGKLRNFKVAEGRATNPRLTIGQSETVMLSWENYFESRFSIYISKYEDGAWSEPLQATPGNEVCFDPALAEGRDGKLYMAYGTTDGFHQNVKMRIFDVRTLKLERTVPVAIGGGLKDRVNLNTRPALAFDKENRLWISWENNRDTHRLDDGDNFNGDRCCSMVIYSDGRIMEPEGTGKWLFRGLNDHLPTFVRDWQGNLMVFTRSGGDFRTNNNWKFRVSVLQPDGWTEPETILGIDQRGQRSVPSIIFNEDNEFWLAWRNERLVRTDRGNRKKETRLNLSSFAPADIKNGSASMKFVPSVVEEHHPRKVVNKTSGRHRIERQKMVYKGEEYTLLLGDLHEHTEGSYCWPAGTDGTLHDDYRFGLYSEGYDFVGITDHTNAMDEPYWRKSIRMADFYQEDGFFTAIPAVEWTLSPANRDYKTIPHGVGHRNVIFSSSEDARKFIRNSNEIYSEFSPECDSSPKLWELIREKKIDCVAIPHHVTDEIHPCDWNVRDEEIEPVVELFQCRGNAEYRGCPRENNVDRHQTTHCDEAFMDYALREKGHKIGFIGSGEHNSMGIGLAALWVKEVSRKGIIEALRARRTFGTTGDKIFMDVKVNHAFMGEEVELDGPPEIEIKTQGQSEIERVELLRNSRVIYTWKPDNGEETFSVKYIDEYYSKEEEVLYYYVRVRQTDEHLAWSSPVFLKYS